MRIILTDVAPDDFIMASRAAKWLLKQPPEQKDAILVYADTFKFYVKRTKTGISVRRFN